VQSNVTYGTAPLSVSFDSTTGGGLPLDSYSWSFGDGGSATTANATHWYATLGMFVVNYSVSDALGEVVHRNLTVDVYGPFRVSASASPSNLTVGANATLTATTTGGSGGPRYSWGSLPSGCGSPSEETVTCLLSRSGTFNVTVSVLDSHNDSATTSVELVVGNAAANNSGTGGTSNSGATLGELSGAAAAGFVIGAVAVFLGMRGRRPPPPEIHPASSKSEPTDRDT
jgi:PKD repeat protein